MTPEQFVYWLQGYVEIAKPDGMVWQEIKNHLDLVLTKKTPALTKLGSDLLDQELKQGRAVPYIPHGIRMTC